MRDRRGSVPAAITCGVVFLIAGCGGHERTVHPAAAGHQRPAQARDIAERQAAQPVRISIPRIDVDAPIDPLTVTGDGVLPAPKSTSRTGWWRAGPEPGERGPAVITGHVDSYRGPAVFYRLSDLEPGDEVLVGRADGSTATFTVRRVERHRKDDFPTESVYGDTRGSTLRLITCGGRFNERTGTYRANIIVYASRAA